MQLDVWKYMRMFNQIIGQPGHSHTDWFLKTQKPIESDLT